ncbi:hypothetical protein ABES02_29230 [Neobacillus pocheonensis]|uniref:hypothetical protein n=1 Tax=Neobacillus pocheonensis TaxID=363869 RepID=UPI003D285412
MKAAAYQQSIVDHGIELPATDPVIIELKHKLSKHIGPESIEYLTFMVQIEERVLKLQRNEHRQRCELRLALYREQLAKIQTTIN